MCNGCFSRFVLADSVPMWNDGVGGQSTHKEMLTTCESGFSRPCDIGGSSASAVGAYPRFTPNHREFIEVSAPTGNQLSNSIVSIIQSINRSINLPINQSTDQSINQSINQVCPRYQADRSQHVANIRQCMYYVAYRATWNCFASSTQMSRNCIITNIQAWKQYIPHENVVKQALTHTHANLQSAYTPIPIQITPIRG